MVWIKRNLYFVVTVVLGLVVTGYCAILLFKTMGKNGETHTKYIEDSTTFTGLQRQNPFPNKENITAAQEDQERVRQFLANFRKLFSDFPTPPKMDAQGFEVYLQGTVNQLTAAATNAGVGLGTNYAFSFQAQMENLSPPQECIEPWLQQLEEIKAILRILFEAKINKLDHIRRSQVSPEDQGVQDDYIGLAPKTNEWEIIAPYKLEFSGFSSELASVLSGFAQSSNCFVVSAVIVTPSKAPVEPLGGLAPGPGSGPEMVAGPRPTMQGRGSFYGEGGSRGRVGGRPPPVAPTLVAGAGAAASTNAPVKFLSEQLLFITMYVDVVKLRPPPEAARTGNLRPSARRANGVP